MKNHSQDMKSMPLSTFVCIPTPKADAQQVVALVKKSGKVIGYQLADSRIISREDAVKLARSDGLQGVGVSIIHGKEYLKSLPDSTDVNNLSSLPTITQH